MKIFDFASNNRLAIRESITEVAFRGALGILMILAAYSISARQLGTYNLAASLGVCFGGLYGGGWAFRISTRNIRKIGSASALLHVIVVFVASFSILCIVFLAHFLVLSSVLVIGLFGFLVNSFFSALLEVLWGANAINSTILSFSTKKLIVTLSSSLMLLINFAWHPKILLLICVQPIINFLILFVNRSSLRALLAISFNKAIIRKTFSAKFEIANSFELSIVGLVTMLTYVIDNLLVAYKFDLSELPSYSIAFAAVAFPTGIIGTTVQRLFSIKGTLIISVRLLVRLAWVTLVLNLIASSLLFCVMQIRSNGIISKSLELSFLLYPYSYSRIVSIVLGVKFGREGNLLWSLSANFMQILLVAGGVWTLGGWLGLPGVAISVSFASVIASVFLYLGMKSGISSEGISS